MQNKGLPLELFLEEGFWYLCSPYSKYEDGIELANEHVCLVALELMERGVPLFAPIPHSHAISVATGKNPKDHEFWMDVDEPMIGAAHGLIVPMMKGWRESEGVQIELEEFRDSGRPIVWIDPAVLGLEIPVDLVE